MSTQSSNQEKRRNRNGFSLGELLIAMTITSMVVGAISSLALTVEHTNSFVQGNDELLQHGRVAVQRIERTLSEAHCSEQFPGFIVLTSTVDGYTLSDILIVWAPTGTAANPAGLPLYNELVLFFPDPSDPKNLLEARLSGESAEVPSTSDTSTWKSELLTYYSGGSFETTQLTHLLETATIGSNNAKTKSMLHFSVTQRPSDAEIAAVRDGSGTWEDLPWVQDVYSSKTGLRQSWCSFDMVLKSEVTANGSDQASIPFFGSCATYYISNE